MKRTSLCCIVLLGSLANACHDDAPEDTAYDLSGAVRDLASSGLGGDASLPNADLAGYELSCDPAVALTGGAAKGHWQYYAACASPEALFQLQASCPLLTLDAVKVTSPTGLGVVSGALVLAADGTFSRTTEARLAAHAAVPLACAQPFGGCAPYASGQAAQFNWLEMSCQPSSDGCSCVIAADISRSDTGTWIASTDGFTTTGAQGGPQSFSASATANTLKHRGDALSARGDRGVTYVLIR